MEKATSSIRRGGAMLWSIGAGYQDLNLIITELKNLRSHTKAIRDSQQTVLQDMTNWACNSESRALKELFANLLDLNALWCEVQTQFADEINFFKHIFEMILEGEKGVDTARNKFADCQVAEQKAMKKLKKYQRKEIQGDDVELTGKLLECSRQRELAQAEVGERIKENEAVKLIRMKEGLLKLSEAYLALSHKCIYIFEAQRDIAKCLPDVADREIHEVRFDGLSGAKDAVARARDRIKDYRSSTTVSSPQGRNMDPPPPYSPSPHYPSSPYNPYYVPSGAASGSGTGLDPGQTINPQPPDRSPNLGINRHSALYPSVPNAEELADAMSSAVISPGT